MRREHYVARLLRGLSGMTQDQIAAALGVHSSLIAQFELGQVLPGRAHLERMAGPAFFKLQEAEDVVDRMLRARRGGHEPGRTAPLPPAPAGRAAGDLYARICEKLLAESKRKAARNPREAEALAALAAELAALSN
jgi:transcriptional regulator with XRE-family HTH domain